MATTSEEKYYQKLENYSREDLIRIIKTLSYNNEYKLCSVLRQLGYEDVTQNTDLNNLLQKYKEEEQEALRKYSETLLPYKGQPAVDIPHEVLNKAMKYFEEAEATKERQKDVKRRKLK